MVTSFNEEIRQIRTIYRHEDMKMYSLLKDKEYENHMMQMVYILREMQSEQVAAMLSRLGGL